MAADVCIICNTPVLEGILLCEEHKRELYRPPDKDIPCSICPNEDTDVCNGCPRHKVND